MEWDLGPAGLAVLGLVSLGFGLVAQLVLGNRTGRWTWLVAAAAYVVVGLLVSEVWFGWATEEDLQPNIDGLSFDEVLLGTVPALAVVLGLRWYLGRGTGGRHVTR